MPSTRTLLGYAPRRREALVFTRSSSGTATLVRRDADGSETPLLVLNRHLAGISPATAVALPARDNQGGPVTHWLLLPDRMAQLPPLVVLPYPGLSFTAAASPANNPAAIDTAVNGALLVAHGYAVLYPSLPLGYDVREPLAAIARAIDAAVDIAIASGRIDPTRIALWGHSYGGYAALCAATQGKRYRAIIASAAISDLSAGYASLDPQTDRATLGMAMLGPVAWYEQGQGRMGAPVWAEAERYHRNSPLMHVEHIHTPVLLLHGDVDFLPVAQAERMFTALFRLGREAQLVRYHGEGHLLTSPANIRDAWVRVFAWLDGHFASKPD